jgi:hypothetical protein
MLVAAAEQAEQAWVEIFAGEAPLVRWGPQAATEAELRSMEQHLDELGLEVAKARTAYEREKKEAEAIRALLNQRMAAAEQLQHTTNRLMIKPMMPPMCSPFPQCLAS